MRFADPRSCVTCGRKFTPLYKKRSARFCSRACILRTVGRGEYTPERAKKIGDAQRGRGAGKSYRKLMGRHEHRVVAERKIGRPLLPGEIVHHIDGDIHNNDPANLEVMTQDEHARRHVREGHRFWEKRRTKTGGADVVHV